MIVIGVVGRIGSGKDELTKVLNRACEVPIFSVGDIARELAYEQGLEANRENLHRISRQAFEDHGRDYFIEQVIERIEAEGWESISITGIRTPRDAGLLRERFGSSFLLVHVEISDETLRYERLKKRDRPRDPETFSEFRIQEQEEELLFNLSEILEMADLTLNNDGSLEDFHQLVQKELMEDRLADELDCVPNKVRNL
jgi:dephospho-CoA kinase